MTLSAFSLGGELQKNVLFGLDFGQQESRTMISKSCTTTLCIAFCFVMLRYVALRYVVSTSRTVFRVMMEMWKIFYFYNTLRNDSRGGNAVK